VLGPVELLAGPVAVVVAAAGRAREHGVIHHNFSTLVALAQPLHHGEKTVLLDRVDVAPLLLRKPSTCVLGQYVMKNSAQFLRIQHVLRKEGVHIRGVYNAVCWTTASTMLWS